MKKLIAISISLVLFASTAFAQLTVGGTAGYGFTPISIQVEDNAKPATGPVNWAHWGQNLIGRLEADYVGEGGVFGAHVRVNSNGSSNRTWAWWQPISQFKLVGGIDSDGQFANNYIVGWGFHGNNAEDYVAFNGFGLTRNAAFYGGWSEIGAALVIAPIEGLAINIGVPYGSGAKPKVAEDVYKKINAQVAYNISGIGEVAVTYIGATWKLSETTTGYWLDKDGNKMTTNIPTTWQAGLDAGATYVPGVTVATPSVDPAAIQAQFYLTAVENLGINLGFKYKLPIEVMSKVTYNSPIAIGLGASYAVSDAFGVKARFVTTFLGNVDADGTKVAEEGFALGVDIMPYFDVGIVKIFVNLGMEYHGDGKKIGSKGSLETDENDSPLSWYVNPYITKSVGSGTLYAGLQFGGSPTKSDNKDHIFFALPIGIQVGF